MHRLIPVLAMAFVGQHELPAQEAPADTSRLEEVRISVMPLGERLSEATASVYALRGDEISKDFAIQSAELYNQAPGVHMATGALNTHRISIRGVGSRTPYSSNRIRAYLDDIPLTSGDGVSTLEDQDLLAIGSMEVLKGPSSALYGSGLGGVIRLNSPYPVKAGWHTSLLTEGASFGSQRYALSGAYKGARLALSGGFSRTGTVGFRQNSEYLRHSAFLHGRLFGPKHQLAVTFSLTDLVAEIPSSLNEEDFLQSPEQAGGTWGIIRGYEEYLKVLTGISLESTLGPRLSNKLTTSLSFSDPYERRPFNILDEESVQVGFREQLSIRWSTIELAGGMEYFHEAFAWATYGTLPEGQGPMLSDQEEQRNYVNAFAYGKWQVSPKVLFNAGLNLNLLSYRIQTLYRADSTDQGGSYRYDPVVSPRVGISIRHEKQVWTYASVGHGFSAPSLEETLLPQGEVNTTLRPETGWNLDVGNRGLLWSKRLSYDLSLYAIFLNDLLVTERLAEDVFTGINAGSAWNRGMEGWIRAQLLEARTDAGAKMDLSLSYQLSRNTFREFVDEGRDYSGKELPGIPRQLLRASLSGRIRGFSLRYQYVFTGRQWMDDANTLEYGGFHLSHLQLGWEHDFQPAPFHLRFYGGVRNLFNVQHASMILINAPSFGGRAPRYYYPGSPRAFYLGMALRIKS